MSIKRRLRKLLLSLRSTKNSFRVGAFIVGDSPSKIQKRRFFKELIPFRVQFEIYHVKEISQKHQTVLSATFNVQLHIADHICRFVNRPFFDFP